MYADNIASSDRRKCMRAQLALAVDWLLTQQNTLMEVDRFAPNRLLFNARSFQACAQFARDSKTRIESNLASKDFVEAALELYSVDGYFVEGAGHDTSYQGVSIRIGQDILVAGYQDQQSRLRKTINQAAIWLPRRVDFDGRIDSSGNTRTCWSGERFFGEKKN
ncbi:MAG: hypothetical protein AB8B87_11955 [Granulosicoccus sp.]